jgi:hypothetical protein
MIFMRARARRATRCSHDFYEQGAGELEAVALAI